MANISYKQSIDCTTQSIFFVRLHSSNNEGLARAGHLFHSLNIVNIIIITYVCATVV